MTVRVSLLIGVLTVAAQPVLGGSLIDRPPPPSLQKDVGCMVKALKAMPGIDSVKSEVARHGGMPTASVQYRDRSKTGQGTTVRFAARGLEPPFAFQTVMGGLHTPGTTPSDFGASVIARAWKASCNVDAYIVFA